MWGALCKLHLLENHVLAEAHRCKPIASVHAVLCHRSVQCIVGLFQGRFCFSILRQGGVLPDLPDCFATFGMDDGAYTSHFVHLTCL